MEKFGLIETEANTLEDFLSKVKEEVNVKYVVVSFSEPNHPSWMRNEDNSKGIFEIPFMNSKIDINTGQQDIKEQAIYEEYGLTFHLLKVYNEVFVYEVIRS